MSRETVQALLRLKHVLDGLKGINRVALSEREHHAYQDTLEQVYDRAAFFLTGMGSGSSQKGNEHGTAILI